MGVLVIMAGKFFPSETLKCHWHRLNSYDLAPSSPPNPHSREIHLGLGLRGKRWIPPEDMGGDIWVGLSGHAGRSLPQDRRWLDWAVQAALKTNTPRDGAEGGREGFCPHPAAESEKLIIARRPEMHPGVIEPSGTSPLGKEATCSLPGCTVQV